MAGGVHGQIPVGEADKPQVEKEPELANTEPPVPPVEPAFNPDGQRVLSREERIEYRDQDGNILDAEQVEALRGKVEFKTRYETRTRLVDESGNELAGEQPVAPPHPDVDGADPSTKRELVPDEAIPKEADPSVEGEREQEQSRAKPASEGSEATEASESEESVAE